MPGAWQYRELASRQRAARGRPLFDGAERIPVAGEDERRHGDGAHVLNGVAVRLDDPVEGLSDDCLPVTGSLRAVVVRFHQLEHRPQLRGTARGEVGVGPGRVGAAAEHLPRHGDGGCVRVRVEQVVSAVVHDRADGSGMPDSHQRCGLPAVTEAADQRPIQVESIDEGSDVVGQQRGGDRAAGVHALPGSPRVRRDHPEVFRQRSQK